MKTIDNRRKYVKDTYRLVFLIVGMLAGAILVHWMNWEKAQAIWADSQVSMLLSPTWESPVQAKEPEPTPSPEELVIAEIREVFGKDAEGMLKVAKCESGIRAKAINNKNKNGSNDSGVFQINSVHGIPQRYLLNSSINIRVAKQLFDAQGYEPWRSSNSCHHILG